MVTKGKRASRRRRKLPAGIVAVTSADGSERFRFWLPGGSNGTKRWGPTVETLEEAVRLRYDATKIAATLPAALVTFGQAVENERNRIARVCRAGTLRWFNAQARVLLRYFGEAKPVVAIKPADIEAFIARRMDGVRSVPGSTKPWVEAPVSASSVLHYKRALRGILAGCKLPSNPLKSVPASAWPRDRSKPTDVFEPEELAQVLMMIRQSGTATAEADHDVLAFLALTGLRRGELARLRVADVDIQRRTMAIDGKTDRAVVRMSADAVDVVRRLIDRVSGDMLIPGGEDAIARVCRRWRTRLKDKRLHAHALRHSFATALLRAGHDIRTVQRHTRHASLVMLQRYLHATADDEAVLGSIDLGLGDGDATTLRRVE